MTRRRIAVAVPLIAIAAAVPLVAPLAQAAPASHKLKLTIHSFTTAYIGKPETPGSRQMGVGLVSGSPVGEGVSTLGDKVTSASQAGIKFSGAIAIYTVNGTLKGTLKLAIVPNSTGGATGSGSGSFTDGTGRYKGAHGTFTFTGSESASQPDFTVHLTGSASY
jgi:hypothetical protein